MNRFRIPDRSCPSRACHLWGRQTTLGPVPLLFGLPVVLLFLTVGQLAAKEVDVGKGGYCFYADGAYDSWLNFVCSAAASLSSQVITTGYDGNVTLKFKYHATKNWDGYFSANFDLVVDDSWATGTTCQDDCEDFLKYGFSSASGDTDYYVKVTTALYGPNNLSCSNWAAQWITISRPACPTTTTINPLYSYGPLDATVTITGTVKDTGCGGRINSANAVQINVTGPGGESKGATVNVNNGAFSWVYTFPFPKLDHYGTYTATAQYMGTNDDHPCQTSNDTEDFHLYGAHVMEGRPWGAGFYDGSTPWGTGPQFVIVIAEPPKIQIVPADVQTSLGEIELSHPELAYPQSETTTRDFTRRSEYPLIALTRQGVDSLVFVNMDGEPVWRYPIQVHAPWGLAYDGTDLWVASHDNNGQIRRVVPETGMIIHTIYPSIGSVTDIEWDGSTQTLLALSEGRPFIYRLSPTSGSVLETLPLSSPDYKSVACYGDGIWVGNYLTREFYLYGQTPGTPGTPGDLRAESGEGMPDAIRLAWADPDSIPPWTQIRIYRDGSLFTAVQPGAQEYTDGGLVEHSYHTYYLRAFRQGDDVEGSPSDTVGTFAGGSRPPRAFHVPGDYASIQAAIDAAADEDTVLVAPGTYGGGVDFLGRDVRVLSTSGPANTILDGEGYPFSMVVFDSTEGRGAVLSGFTLKGSYLHREGVIYCGPDASPSIEGNIIVGNRLWHEGGGIVCGRGGSGSPAIRNNTIAFNELLADSLAHFRGGGIYCRGSAAEISRNIIAFIDNGYGIYVEGDTIPAISCNVLWADELGPYFGCASGSGDLALDPLFCDSEQKDFHLCADSPCLQGGGCGLIGALGQGCPACGAPVDYADHDVGNCVLTVTDQGIIGFMDATQTRGSGFIFPASGTNLLYIGGLWVGQSPAYVANRDYDTDPAKEWEVSTDPDGHIWTDAYGTSDQDIHAGFTDSGASQPRGLSVRQESWAFTDPPNDEFIIVRYFIENRGSDTLSGLYAGVFLDLDIGDYAENTGGTDRVRRLVYMTGGSGECAGVRLLMGLRAPDGGGVHDPPANLTLIDNATYVYPNQYILDADKYAFLAASDPQHILAQAPNLGDYGVLASFGPVSLAPGDMDEVAFAIVGGESLADLQANADRAQAQYLFPAGVPDPSGAAITSTRLLPNIPNPFNPSTVVRFELAQPGRVSLDLYDAGGRLVRTLLRGQEPVGLHTLTWDGRDGGGRLAGSGVYFLRLVAGGSEDRRAIVLMK